jgi:heat-inducible transcriptional repressor
MPGTRELSERKAAILHALVRLYIRTGEPVGSEALAAAAGLGVSSATIRNELSALEELGYLTQPHTSAGRAPTDLAYRYYVDLLPARPRIRDAERRAIIGFFDEALADVDQILRGTTTLLSKLTRYASLALAPSPRDALIARCELVKLGTATLLLVVFDTGRVEKRLVDLPDAATQQLEDISRSMTEAFHGKSAGTARDASADLATGRRGFDSAAYALVAEALGSIQLAAEVEHVLLGGVANIAADETFRRRKTLQRIIEALEHESEMLRVLREAAETPPIRVTIGRENPMPEMWETSLVAAPYAAGGGAVGTIGIVGPTRMDYGAAISAVRMVAERLSAAVEALRG